MSGLPFGQFVDYLVVGVLGGCAVALFATVIQGVIKTRRGKFTAVAAAIVLVILAVLGHVAVHNFLPPESKAPTTVASQTESSSSQAPQEGTKTLSSPSVTYLHETPEQSFLRNNI